MFDPYDDRQKAFIIKKLNSKEFPTLNNVTEYILKGKKLSFKLDTAPGVQAALKNWVLGVGTLNYVQLNDEEKGRFKEVFNTVEAMILSRVPHSEGQADPVIKVVNEKIVSLLRIRLDEIHAQTKGSRKGHGEPHFAIKQILEHIEKDKDVARHHKVINLTDIERTIARKLNGEKLDEFNRGIQSEDVKMKDKIQKYAEIVQKPKVIAKKL